MICRQKQSQKKHICIRIRLWKRPVALNDLISSQFSLHQYLVLFCDVFPGVRDSRRRLKFRPQEPGKQQTTFIARMYKNKIMHNLTTASTYTTFWDFLQAKHDRELDGLFLLNVHGEPRPPTIYRKVENSVLRYSIWML